MRRVLVSAVAALSLMVAGSPALAAAAKAGGTCTKAGATAKSGSTTLVCTKSGKKLIWVKKAVAAPAPTPTPTPTQTPTASGDADSYIDGAVKAFDDWAATNRSTIDITYKIGAGTPADLENWIRQGIPFMSSKLPAFNMPNKYAAVAAADAATFNTLMTEVYGATIADREKGAFGGAPAAAGNHFNVWNLKVISDQNLMSGDAVGMKQTPGHEYFHLLQNNVTGCGPCIGRANEVPQWFWEGPSMFMGLNTARALKFGEYKTELRKQMVTRYTNGGVTNTMLLKDVTVNDGKIDPYAIGFAATELLVSRVGMEKFINIYYEVGKGKTFAAAFESQAGMSLDAFYTLFESTRATLGFAKR